MNTCWDCDKSIDGDAFRCGECPRSPRIDRRVVLDPDSKVIAMEGGTKVYGRDIVQPYAKDGSVNQKFMDRYGDGIYNNKKSQLDGKGKKV